MDKAKILRMCNDIEMIMCEVSNTGHTMQDCDYEAFDKRLKAIVAEITAPPKTNGDRIRQMTDEELARFLDRTCGCSVCFLDIMTAECASFKSSRDCIANKVKWLKQEVETGD